MVEITSGVHVVDGVSPYCYLVAEDDGSVTLVDTGMSRDGNKVLDYAESSMSKRASDIKTIVLTHCHTPYVRGAFELRKATGARVAIHEDDSDYLAGKKDMPVPKGAAGALFRISQPFLSITNFEPDQRLKDGDRVGRLTVVHAPGHTPGSVALYLGEEKLIFVADMIRCERGKLRGPPREFTFDMNLARESMRKISRLDFNMILGGQGEPFKSNDAPDQVGRLSASTD